MGGRGSGGGRSGGGSGTKVSSTQLSKDIDKISKKVVTMEEYRQNYRFFNKLNDADLISAKKITEQKVKKETEKYDKMYKEYDSYLSKNKIPTISRFHYDTSSVEWKNYQKLEKSVEKQQLKAEYFDRSLKHINFIMENRGIKK